MNWTIYLCGEIHTDWRDQIMAGARENNLPVTFTSAVTDHEASDAAGDVLGTESNNFWRDHKSSKVNGIRTKILIESCDIAIVRFGDKYNSGTLRSKQASVQRWASLMSHCMMNPLFIRSKRWTQLRWHGLKRRVRLLKSLNT